MAEPKKTRGVAVLHRGTFTLSKGIVEKFEQSPEADLEKTKDGDGDTVHIGITDRRIKYSMEYTPLTGDTAAVDTDIIGSDMTVTIDAGSPIKFIVESAKLAYTSGKNATFTVDGYNYPKVYEAEATV